MSDNDCINKVMGKFLDDSSSTPKNQTLTNSKVATITAYQNEILDGYYLPPNYLNAYYSRRIEPYLANPTYLAELNPESMYRGMYLTIDELNNITTEGMSLDKVVWTAAGGKGVSFSSNIQEATSYIFQSASVDKKGLGVVFKVKNSPNMVLIDDAVLNKTKTIYKSFKDVPAEDIEKVYIWGEYGLEDLTEIVKKAKAGGVKPNTWTKQFDNAVIR